MVSVLPLRELLLGTTPPVEWAVPEIFARNSLSVLAGEPGAGKSYFAYYTSLALATGLPLFGQSLDPCPVIYFDQENSFPDCTQYLRWAWHGLAQPDLDLLTRHFHFAHFQLGAPDWIIQAGDLITRVQPRFIVFDTTTPICNIKDENDNGEATRAIEGIRKLQAISKAGMLALKHARIKAEDGSYTIRGAKAWLGACDAAMFHLAFPGHPRKDGLRRTKIVPHKVRAFGLRTPLYLTPAWTPTREGIALQGSFSLSKELSAHFEEPDSSYVESIT